MLLVQPTPGQVLFRFNNSGNGNRKWNLNHTDNPVNVGSLPGTVTYTFIPTAPGGCIGAAFNYVVTVNPEPVGVNDIKTVCSDEAINYNLLLNLASLGNNVGSTFSWVATDNVNPLVTGESTIAVNGPIITDIITNLSNS
jgi:hypothetical protein